MATRRRKATSPRRKTNQRKGKPLSIRDFLTRSYAILLWWLAALWWLGVAAYPPSTAATRFSGTLFAAALLLGLLGLWWRYRWLRWGWFLVVGIASFFLWLPGNDWYDRPALRDSIGTALRRYQGVRYHEAGENRLGIDSLGLIRRGTVEGTLLYGLQTLNPHLVRKAGQLWWYDLNAPILLQGARRQARRFTDAAGGISSFDHSLLYPGDMALSRDGSLAFAYLGSHLWISANPLDQRAVIAQGPGNETAAFNAPVRIIRWRFLEMRRP